MPLRAGKDIRIARNKRGLGDVIAFGKFNLRVGPQFGECGFGTFLGNIHDADAQSMEHSTGDGVVPAEFTGEISFCEAGPGLDENPAGNES